MAHERASILSPELRNALHPAARVAVLTGAGVSAASGIPTFRGADGLWKHHRAEDLATPEAFERDPDTVWEWYAWRRGLVRSAQPNPAHRAVVDLESLVGNVGIITQNVDGLHAEAGSAGVQEIHGSLWVNRCSSCDRQRPAVDPVPPELPRCACGALDSNILDRCDEVLTDCDVLLVVDLVEALRGRRA